MFFFCDYRTSPYEVTTQIFKAYLAQYVSQDPGIVPFLYDEYLAKGLSPVAKVLKQALIAVFKSTNFVRLIVDGLDEIQAREHKIILRELIQFTRGCGETCKLFVASQDLPSIRPTLGSMPYIFLGSIDERKYIEEDMGVVVEATLTELDESLNGALEKSLKSSLRISILSKAEGSKRFQYSPTGLKRVVLIQIIGMFLWINLILPLLESSCSLYELKSNVDALPKDLEDMSVILNSLYIDSYQDCR